MIIRNRYIPFRGYKAMCLWPWIFVRKDARITDEVLRHERIHAEQQKEMLILPFYVWYAVEWLCGLLLYMDFKEAYRGVSFEREAYARQSDEDYLAGRKRWAWINYIRRHGNK